jgi:hypothetical protein
MSYQPINLGLTANDGTGDTLRVSGVKTNENFVEIYNLLGNGSALSSGISASSSVVTLTAPTISGVVGGTITSATITTLTGTTFNAGTLALAAGSITDSSGAISFGNENLTTTGSVTAASLDISGNVDVDGTLETDALTIDGVSLAETISDTVGAMVSSNTETNITVTYDDSDNTLDFVIGTLNQSTSGNAATATALETARTIHGVSFDGTANIDLSEVVQDTVGAMFSSNTETNITATYQDADGTIDLVIGTLNQNTTGTAATVTGAAQTNITSVGTLTALQVDNININGNAITSTAGTDLTISPVAGQQIVLDGTIVIDAGVVTGATSITSTAFVGDITGDVTGNADTATVLATARTIGGVSFNGSANINLPGVNSAGNQNTTGSAATLTTARTIGGTSFDGSANIDVALATLATTATVSDSTANTNFPVVFNDESNALLDDTGALRYNPSTGTLLVPNLVVAGTTTTVYAVLALEPKLVFDFTGNVFKTGGASSNFGASITHSRASSATMINASGTLVTVGNNVPRTGHHIYNGSAWVNEGILHESEARTNLMGYSGDLTQSSSGWTGSATIGAVTTGSPFGTYQTISPSSNSNNIGPGQRYQIGKSLTSGSTYVGWALVKYSVGSGWFRINMYDTGKGNEPAYFDLQNGVVGSKEALIIDHGMVDYGDGWWLCWASSNAASGSGGLSVEVPNADTAAGDLESCTAADVILIAGAQLELGATPSSYIPTTTSTVVTRAAETLTVSAANLPYDSTNMSIQIDGKMTGDTLTPVRWLLDANNSILLETGTNNFSFTQEAVGTVDTVTGGSFTGGTNVTFNLATRNGSTFINSAISGTSLTADTTPTALPNLSATDLILGYDFMGTIGQFRMWDEDLGDAGITVASIDGSADGAATFNSTVTATTFVGALTGNVTGNVSGSSGSTTGNAATATALATARTIGGTSFDGTANIDVALATLATTVTVSDSTANTNFPVVFHNESNALLDDTGALRYNPSTGTLLVPNLVVAGTTTQVDTVTMEAANAVVFEGATADDHETTLTIIDPTADRTQRLINQSGYIPLLAALTTTAITSTPEELNILDGATVVVGEINALDLGSTAIGTAIASKAVVLDSSKDYTGIRNLTISGEIDAATGDYSGAVDIAGATTTAAITASGIIKTDDTTAATSTTDGSLQTDGGLSVAADAVIGDDLFMLSDAAVITFGADKDVTLTHVADTGLLLNGTSVIQFNDASQNIGAPSATVLDINATDEIELNATLLDVNANINASGTYTGAGTMTTGGNIVIPNAGNIGSVGDTDSIAIASNGVVTFSQAPVFPDGSIAVADLDIDGATDIGAALVDADLIIVDDGAGGTNRKSTMARIKTYINASASGSVNADDVAGGDAAVLITTSSGNITIDAAADDSDIILKGTDGGADTTFLTIDGSAAGAAAFNSTVTATGFIIGSASIVEAELELLDGLTAGTAIASKVVTTDSSKDTTGQRNLTISGEIDAATGDFSGVVDIAGATTTAAITASGIIKTDDTTAATSTTDGSLQTDGGLSVTLDAVIGDDLILLSDAAVIHFGADSDVTLTHVADTGILLNGTSVIQFNDASQNIGAPSATVLDINATDEIELNATLVDVNANLDVSGTYTGAGTMTTGGNIIIPNAGNIGSVGDTDSIAIASNGVVTFSQIPVMPANSIDSDEYIDGSIDREHLSADIIDGTKIADDAIDSEHYTDGSIDLAHMSVNSIDSDQYVDGSIDLAHMSANSVDSDQYVDGSIDTAHIGDDQITLAKMAGIARGKIIYGDASGDPAVLAPGTNAQVLSTDGTDLTWTDISVSSLAADNLDAGDAAILLTTSSGNITIDAAASDSDIIFKGTDGGADTTYLTIDGSAAGAATFNSTVTATTFVGAVTGDVTGNADTATVLATARTIGGVSFNGSANINLPGVNSAGNQNTSGTAATVTGAAQTNITSVGTLTALQVDNINIDGNAITSTAGVDLTITPLAGQQIVLDGTIIIDAGVITGATSITSTAFVGTLSTAAQPNITSLGTIAAFRSTGIDDNADALAITIDSSENVGIGTSAPENPMTIQDIGGSTFNRDFSIRNGDATNYHRLILGYNAVSSFWCTCKCPVLVG